MQIGNNAVILTNSGCNVLLLSFELQSAKQNLMQSKDPQVLDLRNCVGAHANKHERERERIPNSGQILKAIKRPSKQKGPDRQQDTTCVVPYRHHKKISSVPVYAPLY